MSVPRIMYNALTKIADMDAPKGMVKSDKGYIQLLQDDLHTAILEAMRALDAVDAILRTEGKLKYGLLEPIVNEPSEAGQERASRPRAGGLFPGE